MDYYLPSKWKAIRKILLYLVIFFVLVLFLADTFPGKLLVSGIVDLTHYIFGWVLAVILFTLAILIVIIASLIYFERRKRKRFK
jgi:Ca2+-dependent lipid-binding protein